MTIRSAGSGTQARGLRAFAAALVLCAAAACTPMDRFHGYIPTEADLALLTVGTDTRESVVATVGAPISTGMAQGSDFYYVQSRFRHLGPLAPQEVEREVLAMSFSEAGVLTNIERFGLQDGQVVVLSRRVTDDNLRDTTFIRQLLGNIGRFDLGSMLDSGG